jgi:uracil-DNA glycosylase
MNSWDDFLQQQKEQDYLRQTLDYIEQLRDKGVHVYPSKENVFSAFDSTAFNDVKVVVLGQDPYHGPEQAHGLSFSVPMGIKIPPSLLNIYKELEREFSDFKRPTHGYLQSWAKQGVLLLNTVLTVEQGKAHSHKELGWEKFTDEVIKKINDHRDGIIFLLWGAHAQKKGREVDCSRHFVLNAPHPSPLSAHRGFFGCDHFKKTNQFLTEQGQAIIDWASVN